MGNAFTVAGKKVGVVVGTYLELISGCNRQKRTLMPFRFFNEFLLKRDRFGRFNPLPEQLVGDRYKSLYTGTAGFIGARGKPLGSYVEDQCTFGDGLRTVVVHIGREHALLKDTIVACDHGFAPDGTPFLALYNEKTNRLIQTLEDMQEAGVVLLRFNGPTRIIPIKNPEGGVMERFHGERIYSYIYPNTPDSAIIDLLSLGPYHSMRDSIRNNALLCNFKDSVPRRYVSLAEVIDNAPIQQEVV